MDRQSINPVAWGRHFSMDQAVLVRGAECTLRCAGQTSIVDDPTAELGLSVEGAGDMRKQIEGALANIDCVLDEAGLERSDIVMVRFFPTDMAAFFDHYDVYAAWIGAAGITPPQSTLGVACLALPELMIEIEVVAAI